MYGQPADGCVCGGQRSGGGKGMSFEMLISAENREFGNDKQ
jgi:hypothetical protein